MSSKAKLGDALLQSLITVREQKGNVTIEDMGSILEDMAATLQPDGATDRFLQTEIEKMAQYLDNAKHQILSIAPGDDSNNQHINEASLHLDAVIKTTEEASNNIMDAAEAIQNAIAGTGGETETKIMDATTRIYEACNFQDLTGQRIRKVINTLDYLDEKLTNLVKLFTATPQIKAEMIQEIRKDTRPDAHLMNGPQLPTQAASQADIDALFASIKT